VWWEYRGTALPDDFIGGVKDGAWVSYTDKIVYEHGGASSGNDNVIKTKAVRPAGKKIGRINTVSDADPTEYTIKANLYGENIDTSTQTASFSAYTNKRTAIPGLSADYIQLILSGIRDVVTILTEQ
jgi:hypothetical protein